MVTQIHVAIYYIRVSKTKVQKAYPLFLDKERRLKPPAMVTNTVTVPSSPWTLSLTWLKSRASQLRRPFCSLLSKNQAAKTAHGTCFWDLEGVGTESPQPEFGKVTAQLVDVKHSVLLSKLTSVAPTPRCLSEA